MEAHIRSQISDLEFDYEKPDFCIIHLIIHNAHRCAGNSSKVWHTCKKQQFGPLTELLACLIGSLRDGQCPVTCSLLPADLFEPMRGKSVAVALLSGWVSINFALGLRSEKQTAERWAGPNPALVPLEQQTQKRRVLHSNVRCSKPKAPLDLPKRNKAAQSSENHVSKQEILVDRRKIERAFWRESRVWLESGSVSIPETAWSNRELSQTKHFWTSVWHWEAELTAHSQCTDSEHSVSSSATTFFSPFIIISGERCCQIEERPPEIHHNRSYNVIPVWTSCCGVDRV